MKHGELRMEVHKLNGNLQSLHTFKGIITDETIASIKRDIEKRILETEEKIKQTEKDSQQLLRGLDNAAINADKNI